MLSLETHRWVTAPCEISLPLLQVQAVKFRYWVRVESNWTCTQQGLNCGKNIITYYKSPLKYLFLVTTKSFVKSLRLAVQVAKGIQNFNLFIQRMF